MPTATALSADELNDRAVEVLARFGGTESVQDHEEEPWVADASERFLYIEESRYDGELFVSRFADLDTAAQYRDSQECPEDWNMKAVIDLSTGERFEPQVRTTFVTERFEAGFQFGVAV